MLVVALRLFVRRLIARCPVEFIFTWGIRTRFAPCARRILVGAPSTGKHPRARPHKDTPVAYDSQAKCTILSITEPVHHESLPRRMHLSYLAISTGRREHRSQPRASPPLPPGALPHSEPAPSESLHLQSSAAAPFPALAPPRSSGRWEGSASPSGTHLGAQRWATRLLLQLGRRSRLLYLIPFFCPGPPLGRVSFCRSRTTSRRADRPSKPDMPTTGIGHSGAQAIVPDRLAALKANAPSPRV